MTRPVESIAPSLRTTGQQIAVQQLRRGRAMAQRDAAELKQQRDEMRAAGLLAHNPADPWAATEYRPCEPGCTQHGHDYSDYRAAEGHYDEADDE